MEIETPNTYIIDILTEVKKAKKQPRNGKRKNKSKRKKHYVMKSQKLNLVDDGFVKVYKNESVVSIGFSLIESNELINSFYDLSKYNYLVSGK